jgi:hypothetical protein
MKKLIQNFSLVLLVFGAALLSSCNQDAAPSLYVDENPGATPVITSIVPDKDALAGVTEITINGSNFSSVKENNFVYFGTAKATVLQASPTQLVVKAPTKIANDLDTKVAVHGVENFSNIVKCNLLEAVGVYYSFSKDNKDYPMAVTTDKNENVFVYLNDKGIKKIAPDSTISDWAPKGGESFFFDMKMGPNNILYGTRNLRLISQVEEGKASSTFVTFPTGITIASIDFDQNKNIWASGGGGNLYSVTPSKIITAFPIDYTVSALRVYNGYVYVAGKKDGEEAIYRYKINSETSIGSKEKYFDIGVAYGIGKVSVGAITFSSEGDLIIGTNGVNEIKDSGGIVIERADSFILINSAKVASIFYPELIGPKTRSIAWGTKKNLFYVRERTKKESDGTTSVTYSLVRVGMQKFSAPYYGIQ